MFNRTLGSIVVMLFVSVSAHGQDDKAAYEARLKAGREAAYKKYLLRPQLPVKTSADASAAPAYSAQQAAEQTRVLLREPEARHIFAGQSTPYAFGDDRYNYYYNLNLPRQQRYTEYPLFPYIYQPAWDWRYRRSWPRPVRVRDYVRSHWLYDGQNYTYVPGHVEYRTEWITHGWPRYHWRGSHYSVSISYNR